MEPASEPKTRIDKWLWAVRIFKTRAQASAACARGHVCVNGRPVKASKGVTAGETISAVTAGLTRTVKVRAPLMNRVGASLVANYLEDLTPASEYAKRAEEARVNPPSWPQGFGRPTKRARRRLQRFFSEEGGER